MTKREQDAQLTKLGTERVTWNAAAAHVRTHAEAAFMSKDTKLAMTLREIHDAFKDNEKRVSEEQDQLLRKMGVR